ncbi:hypothetical protein PV325_003538 [Microctonus aethiopoides]|nr:hypothetical protein PV325_003538 [Microctonus aethiopoides]
MIENDDGLTIDTLSVTYRDVNDNIESNNNDLSLRLNNNYTNILANLFATTTVDTDGNFNQTFQRRDTLYIVIPITIIYSTIFFTGLIGNVSTCVVIAKNRSMHTATNYYLFSLAVSDLLLLVSGLPPEMYYIWSHFPYVFGEAFCIIQSFAAETSANATVLTITAFTVERYVAICHPFLSHTKSKLSRAIKYVVFIWLLALCLAIPQAIQFGVVYSHEINGTMIQDTAMCSVKWMIIEHAFEISTILFFVLPMTIIIVLYILIGIKLRHSRLLMAVKQNKRNPFPGCLNHVDSGRSRGLAQRNVIRMLAININDSITLHRMAVVVAFFICWAPFHAQRLLAVYAQNTNAVEPHPLLITVYTTLTYISGIFYYLSTTVNPLLYNIMSNKFREAFKIMLAEHCGGGGGSRRGGSNRRSLEKTCPRRQTYSSLSPYQNKLNLKQLEHRSGSSASDDMPHLSSHLEQLTQDEKNQQQPQELQQQMLIKVQKSSDQNHVINWPMKNSEIRSCHRSDLHEVTLVTSLANDVNEGCNNIGGVSHVLNRHFIKDQTPVRSVTIGILAERLRHRTRGLFTPQHMKSSSRPKFKCASGLPQSSRNHQLKLQSRLSTESANTISNTSLQDMDTTEFSGSELSHCMGEMNSEIAT